MASIVLSLCDLTGNMVQPWADNGCDCYILDVQHPPGYTKLRENITAIGCDVKNWFQHESKFKSAFIAFAFPPCTDLAVSGARWFKDKGLGALIDALEVVESCRLRIESIGCPWMLENPVGMLSTYWRKPNHTFNPNEYGGYLTPPDDFYTKRTCLWTGSGFVMPVSKPVPPSEGSRMHGVGPGPDRANIRSETPKGFAQAVYQANKKRVRFLFNGK